MPAQGPGSRENTEEEYSVFSCREEQLPISFRAGRNRSIRRSISSVRLDEPARNQKRPAQPHRKRCGDTSAWNRVERRPGSEALGAIACAIVGPVLLNQVVAGAPRNVGLGAVGLDENITESPGAFVGVLPSTRIEPAVANRIRYCFNEFMRNGVRHSIGSQVVIGRGLAVAGTTIQTPLRVSDKAGLDPDP